MRFLSLFSGIEAATVAWAPLGWECMGVAEIDRFPCALLEHYYPDVPNLGNVAKITAGQVTALGCIDLVVFGFPCQDLSVAGKRMGLKGERSGLFFDAMRVVRWSGCRFALAENVPGLFSSNDGRDFAAVVGEMAGVQPDVPDGGWANSGFLLGPDALVEWAVLDAQFFGVPQRRRRVFIVRDSGDWRSRPPLLAQPYSLSGHPAPSRETRQSSSRSFTPSSHGSYRDGEGTLRANGGDAGCGSEFLIADVAPTISARTKGGGGLGTDFDCDGGLISCTPEGITGAMSSKWSKGTGGPAGDEHYNLIAHSLRADGFDASEDGTGRGTPIVPTLRANGDAHSGFRDEHGLVAYGIDEEQNATANIMGCLKAREKGGGFEGAVAFDTTQITSKANYSNPKFGDPSHPLAAGAHAPAVAFNLRGREGGTQAELGSDVATAMRGAGGTASKLHMFNGMAVRRLTPVECERLQGFPDNYTKIDARTADGSRYKALGNSFAVPVVRWIGQRIQMIEDMEK